MVGLADLDANLRHHFVFRNNGTYLSGNDFLDQEGGATITMSGAPSFATVYGTEALDMTGETIYGAFSELEMIGEFGIIAVAGYPNAGGNGYVMGLDRAGTAQDYYMAVAGTNRLFVKSIAAGAVGTSSGAGNGGLASNSQPNIFIGGNTLDRLQGAGPARGQQYAVVNDETIQYGNFSAQNAGPNNFSKTWQLGTLGNSTPDALNYYWELAIYNERIDNASNLAEVIADVMTTYGIT